MQLFGSIVSAARLSGFRGMHGYLGLKVCLATFGGRSLGLIAPDLFAELASAAAIRNTADDQGICFQRRHWPSSSRPPTTQHVLSKKGSAIDRSADLTSPERSSAFPRS